MFERYTEKARRVIFFARYEASAFGASQIEAEHILLALLREDKTLRSRLSHLPHGSAESIRMEIEGRRIIRERTSSHIDLPLSEEAKHVLAFAAEESDRLGDRHIGAEHLLLGLLREEKSIAAEILYERGLRLSDIRKELMRLANARQSTLDVASTAPPDEVTMSHPVTQKLSLDVSHPADHDERWIRRLSEACIDAGLFKPDELLSEFARVAGLRRFSTDAEALLRTLASKGLVDPQNLSELAFEFRDEKQLAEFIEKLRQW